MKMWMIYDREGLARNKDYVTLYETACAPYGIEVEAVYDDCVKKRITGGETPVFALVRTINPEVNRFFEQKKIPVFNSYLVSQICNDKGKTLTYLKETVFCVPSLSFCCLDLSYICGQDKEGLRTQFLECFEYSTHEEQERRLITQAEDFVLKSVTGHGGSQVFSLFHERDRIMKEMQGQEFVLQPMVQTGSPGRDLRVYVIGQEIIAAVMRSSAGDFRANYSRGAEVSLHPLDTGQKEIVRRVIRKFDFGMAGIDFILDKEGKMVLNEIEDVVGARMLYQCAPEINIVTQYVRYLVKEKLHIV